MTKSELRSRPVAKASPNAEGWITRSPRQSACQFSFPASVVRLKLRCPDGDLIVAGAVSGSDASATGKVGVLAQLAEIKVNNAAAAIYMLFKRSSQRLTGSMKTLQIIAIEKAEPVQICACSCECGSETALSDLQNNEKK
jgi:hypothetical protein